MVQITLPDGSQREFPGPVTVAEVAASIGAGLAKAALAGKVDGKVVDEFHKEAGDTALAGAKQKLTDAGMPYSAHILLGEAAPTIVEFANDKSCSKIIMGARGLGSVVGLFMGSVATKVLHLSPVPVLLVK